MQKLILVIAMVLSLAFNSWAAVDFDGDDDHIDFGSGATLDQLTAMTLYIKVNVDEAGATNNARLIMKRDTANTGYWEMFLDVSGSQFGISFLVNYTTTNLNPKTVLTEFNFDTEYTIILTWDGSATSANVHIYKNNVEADYQAGVDGDGTRSSDATQSVWIGDLKHSSVRPLDGIIREFAIWERVITATERAQLEGDVRHLPLQMSSNLALYATLDQGTDGTTSCFNGSANYLDLSGNGNNGTGDDGADNNGLICLAEAVISYPPQ